MASHKNRDDIFRDSPRDMWGNNAGYGGEKPFLVRGQKQMHLTTFPISRIQ